MERTEALFEVWWDHEGNRLPMTKDTACLVFMAGAEAVIADIKEELRED